ncbi:hypothetical protein K8T06_09005 [bacterium]|nr:hypothetical protein [bacterium]
MSNLKQPAISYRNSIWLFSFLLLILFAVFSVGVGLNVLQMGSHWRQSEFDHFLSTSNSIAMLLQKTAPGKKILSGEWNDSLQVEITRIFHPFRLNTMDRVILVFRRNSRQIFPVVNEQILFPKKIDMPVSWEKGWDGLRSFSVEYTASDGQEVIAAVIPDHFSDAGPGVLIVIERDMKVFNRINNRIPALIIMCITGLLFAYILVLYYGRKMLQPFTRLEDILVEVETVDSDVLKAAKGYKDPVQRSIETFAVAVSKLHDQEERLEDLSNHLELPAEDYEEDLLATVNAGIITFDNETRIQSFTSRIPLLLNLFKEDIIGKTCDSVFGYESILCQTITTGLSRKTSIRQRQWKWEFPGQSPVWISISTTLIRSKSGNISGVGCVVRDITVLKRLRSQIREKEHLAALGELSAGIAHEFRNPLGAILGNAQYLASESKSSEFQDIALEIYNEVQGLERIIRDFLNFARPSHLEVSSVNISDMIREELLWICKKYNERIKTSLKVNNDKICIVLDENLFRQVLKNVFLNACQVMNGCGELEVQILKPRTQESDGQNTGLTNWVIRVIDSGPGIPVEQSEALFKPFFSRREGGTGLGLAIVKKIVLLHNGFIEFEKGSVSGAVLRITIPETYDPDCTIKILKDDIDY